MKFQSKSAILAAAITALAMPMLASALVKSNDPEEASIAVSYSANDLNSQEGRAILKGKLARQQTRSVAHHATVNCVPSGSSQSTEPAVTKLLRMQ